jgi:heme oxygenase
MADADDPWIDRNFEAQVRQTAYFLWENDGRPHGREQQYWFAALDRCLRQHQADELLRKEPSDRTGMQVDDNIDDLGHPINDPDAPPLEQPVSGKKTV